MTGWSQVRAAARPRLIIHSLEELLGNEREIVERVNRQARGGQLFVLHPFMLLEDVGVALTDEARRQVLAAAPAMDRVSVPRYQALRNAASPMALDITVKALFRDGCRSTVGAFEPVVEVSRASLLQLLFRQLTLGEEAWDQTAKPLGACS